MTVSQKKEIKNNTLFNLEGDFKNCVLNKKEITEYPKRIWFKGSRYR